MGKVLECQGERNFQNLEQCHEIQGEITSKTIYPIRYPCFLGEISLKSKNNFEAEEKMARFSNEETYQNSNYNSNDNILKNQNQKNINKDNLDINSDSNKTKSDNTEKLNNDINKKVKEYKNEDTIKDINKKEKSQKEENNKENKVQKRNIMKLKKEDNNSVITNQYNINSNYTYDNNDIEKNKENINMNINGDKNMNHCYEYENNRDIINYLDNNISLEGISFRKNDNIRGNKIIKRNHIINMKRKNINKSPNIKYSNNFFNLKKTKNSNKKEYFNKKNSNNENFMSNNQTNSKKIINKELKDKKIISGNQEVNSNKDIKASKYNYYKHKSGNLMRKNNNSNEKDNNNKNKDTKNKIKNLYINNKKEISNFCSNNKRHSDADKNINNNNFISNKRFIDVNENKKINKDIKHRDKNSKVYESSKKNSKLFNTNKPKKCVNKLEDGKSGSQMKKYNSFQNLISSANTDSISSEKYKKNIERINKKSFIENNLYNRRIKNQIPLYRRFSPEEKQKKTHNRRMSYLSSRKNILKSSRSVSGHKSYNFRDDFWTFFNKDSFLNTSKNRTIKNIDFNINTHLEHSNSDNKYNSILSNNKDYNNNTKSNNSSHRYYNSMNFNHDFIDDEVSNKKRDFLISNSKENNFGEKNKKNDETNNIREFIKVRIPFNGTQICPALVNYSTNNFFILNYNNLNRINDNSILYDGNIYKVVKGQNGNTKLFLRYFQISKNYFRYYKNIYSVLIYNEKPLVQFDVRFIQDVEQLNVNLINNIEEYNIKIAFSINLKNNSDFFIFATHDKELGQSILNIFNLLRKYYEDERYLFD